MAVRLDHNSPPGVSYRALALLTRPARCIVNPVSGGDSGGETPVPISNTAVKPSSADGTARSPCGRVGRRRILCRKPGSRPVGVGLSRLKASAMRRAAVLLAMILCGSSVRAPEVSFTLTLDYQILGRALRDALEADRGGEAVLWGTRAGCRSLVLRDIGIEPGAGRVRFVARGTARLGFGFLGFCFAPVSWNGYLDSLATPEVSRDWQLRFRDLDSHLYDAEWRRTAVATRLWELVKGRLEERLEAFRFDVAPPIDEAAAPIRASARLSHAEPVVAALRSLHPRGVAAEADGVKMRVAVDLPPPPPAIPVPEAP